MYAATKRAQEILAMTFFHQYGLPVTVLRIAAVNGLGGGRPHHRQFVKQLAEGKRIQIPQFAPNELIHFVDLRDVGRMHIVAGDHPNAVGEIFNCCGPAPTRGSEFSADVQRVVPGIKVETSLWRGSAVAYGMLKAKRLIGFEPQYTPVDSLQRIVDWVHAGGLEEDWPE
jgi:nucleoside-diphosphate-sugar epimerase